MHYKTHGTSALKRRAEYDDHDNPTALYAPGRDMPTRLFWSNQDTEAEKKQHLLRKSISPLGIVSKTVYDLDMADEATPKGLPLEKRVENAASSLFIAGKTEYTANKNYISRQVDARNKAVITVTDPNKGTVTSVTDPKGSL